MKKTILLSVGLGFVTFFIVRIVLSPGFSAWSKAVVAGDAWIWAAAGVLILGAVFGCGLLVRSKPRLLPPLIFLFSASLLFLLGHFSAVSWTSVQYQISGRPTLNGSLPLIVPGLKSTITVTMTMELPALHAESYLLFPDDCLDLLTVNGRKFPVDPFCDLQKNGKKIALGAVAQPGTNTIVAVISDRGYDTGIDIIVDPWDPFVLFPKIMIIVCLILAGISLHAVKPIRSRGVFSRFFPYFSFFGRQKKQKNSSICALLFLLLFFTFTYIHQYDNANQNSRLDLLHALAKGTVSIDEYQRNTSDKAFFEGHYYSDKAPGAAAVGFPGFTLGRIVLQLRGIPVDGSRGWVLLSWITAVLSCGVLAAAGCTALYALLARWIGRRSAICTALLIGLGSLVLPYATMYMSHAISFGLLAIALWCSESRGRSGIPKTLRAYLRTGPASDETFFPTAAGFCAGLAIAGEFTAAPAAFVIALLVSRRSLRDACLFLAGICPMLLIIPLHNLVVFHSLFSTGYDHVLGYNGMKKGFYGIQAIPNLRAIFGLLFSEYRGLFFWCPVLLLAFAGLPAFYKKLPMLCVLSALLVVLQVALISTYPYWDGGWAVGPRHLVVLLPFMAVALGFGVRLYPKIAALLAVPSVALMFLATSITALPPDRQYYPLRSIYIPQLLQQRFTRNLLSEFGIKGYASLIPLAVVLLIGVLVLLLWTADERSKKDR